MHGKTVNHKSTIVISIFIAVTITVAFVAAALLTESEPGEQKSEATSNNTDLSRSTEISTKRSVPGDSPDVAKRDVSRTEGVNENIATLTSGPHPSVKKRLEPWFAQYRSNLSVGDPVDQYIFVDLNLDLLADIRRQEINRFSLKAPNATLEIVADSIFEFEDGWIINGYLPSRSDMSEARIIVRNDGTVVGDIHLMGTGRINIYPTPEPPTHVVYLSTGDYMLD